MSECVLSVLEPHKEPNVNTHLVYTAYFEVVPYISKKYTRI